MLPWVAVAMPAQCVAMVQAEEVHVPWAGLYGGTHMWRVLKSQAGGAVRDGGGVALSGYGEGRQVVHAAGRSGGNGVVAKQPSSIRECGSGYVRRVGWEGW